MTFVTRPDGCNLYVESHGDAAALALLMLEGMGGDLPGWRRNIPTLAAACHVLAYDHRGNGRSDEPTGPVTMATFLEDAIGVLDAFDTERAHIYGQSFGGMVAQELALTHPERVRTLILGCTHAGHAHAVWPERANGPKGEPWRALYALDFPDAHPEHVAEDLATGARGVHHDTGERRQWEAIQAWDAFERLDQITAPTLVLHGTQDQLIAPENARMIAERIPGAELHWLEGAGHVYHSEQAAAADAAVLEFIRRHS